MIRLARSARRGDPTYTGKLPEPEESYPHRLKLIGYVERDLPVCDHRKPYHKPCSWCEKELVRRMAEAPQ